MKMSNYLVIFNCPTIGSCKIKIKAKDEILALNKLKERLGVTHLASEDFRRIFGVTIINLDKMEQI